MSCGSFHHDVILGVTAWCLYHAGVIRSLILTSSLPAIEIDEWGFALGRMCLGWAWFDYHIPYITTL